MLDHTFLNYFFNADLVIKSVMLILLVASIISWTLIFQRSFLLSKTTSLMKKFEQQFWAGTDLSTLYSNVNAKRETPEGLEQIFHVGFREFARLKQHDFNPDQIMEGVERSMRIAIAKEEDRMEQNLSFLATIGSISPYIGLFGTVWGIMMSFHALGSAEQATIAMVAPGISEALVATAMGLFAAIPAVIAYNRYTNKVGNIVSQYDIFQDELTNILYRQANLAAQITN